MTAIEEVLTAVPSPFWVAGEPRSSSTTLDVTHPYDGRRVGVVAVPTDRDVEDAVAAAATAASAGAALPAHARADALAHVSHQLSQRSTQIAKVITDESGKPLKWATVEVARAVSVFRWAAEEARRWSGEVQRLDTESTGEGRIALTRRFPRGPVLGITPFNFPLNLVAHKVAPALAVGAPVVLKPAPKTPLSALLLAQILSETELPPGMFSVLTLPNDRASALVEDPRLPVVSFTGSGPVGWSIKEAVPRKHVTLELGGNGAAVVCRDWSSPPDLEWAASRLATFANYQAGQSCISVQRLFVHRAVYEPLLELLVAKVRELRTGDPADPDTDVGPLIDEAAADRVVQWIQEGIDKGGRLVVGGQRAGSTVEPTILTGVPPDARVACEEVFGPVICVDQVDDDDEAFARVNDSTYGLQVGVFTHDLRVAFRAHQQLQVGGVIVGDVPSYRADQMPYGGVKDSGVGREGLRFAMEDFTHERVLVLTGVAL